MCESVCRGWTGVGAGQRQRKGKKREIRCAGVCSCREFFMCILCAVVLLEVVEKTLE